MSRNIIYRKTRRAISYREAGYLNAWGQGKKEKGTREEQGIKLMRISKKKLSCIIHFYHDDYREGSDGRREGKRREQRKEMVVQVRNARRRIFSSAVE